MNKLLEDLKEDGSASKKDGSVSQKEGSVSQKDGSVSQEDGSVSQSLVKFPVKVRKLKKKRSSSQLERLEALNMRMRKDCELCGFQHWCTGVPAPTDDPIQRQRIGEIDTNYKCDCKVCKVKYPHLTIDVPGQNNPHVLPGFSCESSGLIYAFYCTTCRKVVYIGSTTQTLRARISTHQAGGNHLVRQHEEDHEDAVQYLVLEAWSNGADLIKFLKSRECHWTNKFEPKLVIRKAHGSRCFSC